MPAHRQLREVAPHGTRGSSLLLSLGCKGQQPGHQAQCNPGQSSPPPQAHSPPGPIGKPGRPQAPPTATQGPNKDSSCHLRTPPQPNGPTLRICSTWDRNGPAGTLGCCEWYTCPCNISRGWAGQRLRETPSPAWHPQHPTRSSRACWVVRWLGAPGLNPGRWGQEAGWCRRRPAAAAYRDRCPPNLPGSEDPSSRGPPQPRPPSSSQAGPSATRALPSASRTWGPRPPPEGPHRAQAADLGRKPQHGAV